MSKGTLQFITSALSVTVLLQAVFILGNLPSRLESSEPEFPETLVQEIVSHSQQEAQQFLNAQSKGQARLSSQLRAAPSSTEAAGLELWLTSPTAITEFDIQLSFQSQALEILDADPEIVGIQLDWGEAEEYILNEINPATGTIHLLGTMPEATTGRLRLGTLLYKKHTPTKVSLTVEHIPQSFEASYVKDAEHGRNILVTQPVIQL